MAQITHDIDQRSGVAHAALLPLFAAAICLSAFLLFSIQPMFTKMILPVLGGSPSVWSVAMVFFQALLLAGYAYAHFLARKVPLHVAALAHLGVMACAFVLLPIALAAGWGTPPPNGEALWLLGLFLVSVGLPFFAISANGPLLQAWFSRSNHRQAADPYFLYAASNAGSFLALIAYPILIEPFLPLKQQSLWWTQGFVLLAILIAASAAVVGARGQSAPAGAARLPAAPPVSVAAAWRERLYWIAIAFVPSGLLVAVTAHISTDVAAAPLLWVVPLALFLLTFVLAFRDRPPIPLRLLVLLQVGLTAAVLLLRIYAPGLVPALVLNLGLFFVNAMICHSALYQRRPSADRLTEFYLCLSVGGVLGGIFCGLLAPRIFSTVLEYPILLVLALFCRPQSAGFARPTLRTGLRALATFLVSVGIVVFVADFALPDSWLMPALVVPVAVIMVLGRRRPEWVLIPAIGVALATVIMPDTSTSGQSYRSFFGVNKVTISPDGRFRLLSHGTTLHGAMRIANDDGTAFTGRPVPATYYAPGSPIPVAIDAVRAARGGLDSVEAIGLGSGSLACYIQPGESWTFLEIDPEVVRLASDPAQFRFLSACAPGTPVVLGDARLTLAERQGGQSLIILDAFSSDAIPNHLVTTEAMGLYLSKLDEHGVLVAHISNRHLELRNILARVAAEHGLVTYVRDEGGETAGMTNYRAPVIAVAIARNAADLGTLTTTPGWRRVEPDMSRRPWSDDYSNIVEAIVDKTEIRHDR